jgi:alcohol dehydrogenase (cytochrome c)
VHDWDSLEMPVLLDAPFNGQPRKLLLQANRNGVYYILDRTDGKFLRGVPFVSKVDWMSGFSPEGRPILTPGHEPTVQGAKTCPSTGRCDQLPSPAYNPDTKLFYLIARKAAASHIVRRRTSVPDRVAAARRTWKAARTRSAGSSTCARSTAVTGKKVWDFEQISSFHYGPGLLSTAGGLIFAPEQQGMFTCWMRRAASRSGTSIRVR